VLDLAIELHPFDIIDSRLGTHWNVSFEGIYRRFHPAGTGPEELPKEAHSLESRIEPSANQACLFSGSQQANEPYNNSDTDVYKLRLKFINVCEDQVVDGELFADCQAQIDSAQEVWVDKAAISLVVEPDIDDASEALKDTYCRVSNANIVGLGEAYKNEVGAQSPPSTLEDLPFPSSTDAYPGFVEIYIAKKVEDTFGGDSGGGTTYDSGQGSAFCVLQRDRLEGNSYLLAHELGHVFGLDHPCEGVCSGSFSSVMEPLVVNDPTNTRQNCRIFVPERFGPPDFPECGRSLNCMARDKNGSRRFCLDG
jgi:hypothetical protein